MNAFHYFALVSVLVLSSLPAVSQGVPPNKEADPVKHRVDQFSETMLEALHLPGMVVGVVKNGKIVFKKAYGLESVEFDVKAKPDTAFLLASITKSFTATCVMMLVEQGKVEIDKPISTYLTDAPEAWKEITVRRLLTHTGGLKDRWEEETPGNWRMRYTTEAMYEAAKKTPLDFPPGTQYQYSDQAYFLLGLIVERVSGKSYRDFLSEHIFKPLGMDRSGTILQTEIVKDLASGYTKTGNKLYHNHRRMDFGLVSHFGIYSTVEDMAKFDAALYTDKLLKKSTLEQMWLPQSSGGYGLGWFIETFNGVKTVYHSGATGTAFYRVPARGYSVIVLTNLEAAAGGYAHIVAKAILRAYVPELSWSSMRAIKDSDSALTASHREEATAATNGTLTESKYSSSFLTLARPAMAAAKASLKPFGPITAFELLQDQTDSGVRTRSYRIQFKDVAFYSNFTLNAEGKISNLTIEEDLAP